MSTSQKYFELGMELKVARIEQGFHLYQVARLAGISAARLSQFEGGHRIPPPELETKLRAILGLPGRIEANANR